MWRGVALPLPTWPPGEDAPGRGSQPPRGPPRRRGRFRRVRLVRVPPRMPLSASSSTEARRAFTPGGRTTRPWSMPGRSMSCRNAGRPRTLAGRSERGTLDPMTEPEATGRSWTDASMGWLNRSVPAYRPIPIRSPSPAMSMPSTSWTSSTWTLRSSAAARRRAWRSAAAATRSPSFDSSIERLPDVTPSSGERRVSTGATVTISTGSPSSCATIWARAVRMPCPYSTLPL